jgi:hypothetical protein
MQEKFQKFIAGFCLSGFCVRGYFAFGKCSTYSKWEFGTINVRSLWEASKTAA